MLMKKDMRFKIISEGLTNGVTITCRKYNISRTLYYRWLNRYKSNGIDGLSDIQKDFVPANKTDSQVEDALLDLIKEYPDYGPRALKYLFDELGHNISESAIYNIMKRHNLNRKELRIKFAKGNIDQVVYTIPPLTQLSSGECWVFWIIDYGPYKDIGNLYEYTLYDLTSKIACTRLYNKISISNFEDLLTAVAIPVAQSLHLNIKYLSFLDECKLINKSGKNFKSNIEKVVLKNGVDFKVHILTAENIDLEEIHNFKKDYTEGCLSFLMPFIQDELPFNDLKTECQKYVKNYNLDIKSDYHNGLYSPVDYHNQLTDTKLILPMWAYIGRKY